MSPLIVYLDSSDFSNLADTSKHVELMSVKSGLLQLIADGRIECVFSMAHVVEMAPITAHAAPYAMARANAMSTLCGLNALPSVPEVLQMELAACRMRTAPSRRVTRHDGVWFPELDILKGLVPDLEEPSARGGPVNLSDRTARRKFERELRKIFPLEEEGARVLARYAAGAESLAAASDALRAKLCDVKLFFRWAMDHRSAAADLVRSMRSDSAALSEMVQELTQLVSTARAMPKTDEETRQVNAYLRSPDLGMDLPLELQKGAQELAGELLPASEGPFPTDDLAASCPGYGVLMRTAWSSVRSSVGETPRKPLKSDFLDAVHATYAPYVDVFRADAFMAQHVHKHSAGFGTKVVSKLIDLLPTIDGLLRGREQDRPTPQG